jgi:hypothetical protein
MTKLRLAMMCAVLSLALGWAVSCRRSTVDLTQESPAFQPSDYQKVFDRWTRDERVIPVDGMDNVLSIRATMLSREFRTAYLARLADDLKLSPVDKQAEADKQFFALSKGHEFYVSLMSAVRDGDKLEPDEGPWHILLEDDRGRQVTPLEVLRIKKPKPVETEYFDFDPVQRRAYRLIFPLEADDGQAILSDTAEYFVLSLSSPLGKAALRWDTKGDGG